VEPKTFKDTNVGPYWICIVQEELTQFKRNKVSELVPRPNDRIIIRPKWIFRNKLDENHTVVRNKVRLVAQGYKQ
jgi:hypothetical protein